MANKHGIAVIEENSNTKQPSSLLPQIHFILGTAPVNLSSNPKNVTNNVLIFNDAAEAKSTLGYTSNFKDYTLCQSIHTYFDIYKTGPVAFVNVLDPKIHKTAVEATELNVINKQAVLDEFGVITSSLVVMVGETELKGEDDYITSFNDDGKLVITILTEDVPATISVTADKLNPEAAKTASNLIGSFDPETGKRTGLELLQTVYPKFGYTVSFISAPGFSQISEVGTAIQAKCERINGVFSCECLLDLATTNVKKYTDVQTAKNTAGYNSNHAVVLWPKVRLSDGNIVAYSADYGAQVAYLDSNNDDVPSSSPSNQKLHEVSGAVLEDGTDIYLDQEQANVVNDAGVVTLLNLNGWRTWGNETAAFPENTQTKDKWIVVRRMFSWQGNRFIKTYIDQVDNPANTRLIESIVDQENYFCNSLVSTDKIAGASIEFVSDGENMGETLLAGEIAFRQKFAPYLPAKSIDNYLSFDPDLLINKLTGGA